jgi:hypothetical protein
LGWLFLRIGWRFLQGLGWCLSTDWVVVFSRSLLAFSKDWMGFFQGLGWCLSKDWVVYQERIFVDQTLSLFDKVKIGRFQAVT